MLEFLHEIRDYLESTIYSDPDVAVSGRWYCPECVRLIRSTNDIDRTKSGLHHDSACRLNNLLNKTIQKIEELEMTKEQIQILEDTLKLLERYPFIFNISRGIYYCPVCHAEKHDEECTVSLNCVKLNNLIKELKKND